MKNGISLILLLLILFVVAGCIESNSENGMNELIVIPNVTGEIESTTIENEESGLPMVEDANMPMVEDANMPMVEETNMPIVEETVVPTITNGVTNEVTTEVTDEDKFLVYIFKVNDEYIMYDKNIRLIELATEEGIADVNVDNEQYRLTFDIEQEINGRTIKIADINGIDQTVKIMVK